MNDLPDDVNRTDARDVIAAASSMANKVQNALDRRAVLVPEGYSLQDLEPFQDQPREVQKRLEAHTLEGFLSYTTSYANETTALFADPVEGEVRAVFDYHQPTDRGGGDPHWEGHQIEFFPERSRQLKAWMAHDGQLFEQVDFAHFIEEHAEDVTDPAPARMLEIVRDFEARRNVDFRQASRVESGDIQITYEEETQSAGEMTVPEKIELYLPVHKGGPEFKLEARFMYRVKREGLRLKYRLLQADELLERAAEFILEDVEAAAEELDVPVYYVKA